jgi:proteic killer suppression protein
LITSFGDQATEEVFHGRTTSRTRRIPPDVRRVATRKLDMLNAAHALGDLRSPPGNRLEALAGDLRGFHSIRVNDRWRLIFRWLGSDAAAVALTDYHRG